MKHFLYNSSVIDYKSVNCRETRIPSEDKSIPSALKSVPSESPDIPTASKDILSDSKSNPSASFFIRRRFPLALSR